MAYDGHRNPPPSSMEQPPYSLYDAHQDPRAYQSPTLASSYQSEHAPRSRAPSRAQNDGLYQQQSVFDATAAAANNTPNTSNFTGQVSPEVIAQIAAQVRAQVIDSLKESGITAATQSQQPPPPPSQAYVPQSPTNSTTASYQSRNVYTPPSPDRHEYSSPSSGSPEPPAQDPHPFHSTKEDLSERYGERNPSPERPPQARPAPLPRTMTSEEETILEKIWQPLFDAGGNPTPRLGQFLRGLASHIIEDFEPRNSLVVTPSKMLRFYDDVRVGEETYPWNKIFGKLEYSAIGRIYRQLGCQHHLVQDDSSEKPYIPALTADGFYSWMVLMIQANPDTEFERLAKAVLDMPISNADERKERFPKELSRRLFPKNEDLQARRRCEAALSNQGASGIRRSTTPPPPPSQPSENGFERERTPYHHRTDSSAVADDEGSDQETPLAVPIERERKPYTAKPGGGKDHEDDTSSSTASLRSESHAKPSRSSFSTSQPTYPASSRTNDYPAPSSTQYHHRTGSRAHNRRARSPSLSSGNNYTRSDSVASDVPPSQHASNLYSDPEDDRDGFPKEADRRRHDRARRPTEDEGGSGRYTPRYDYEDYRRGTGGNGYSSYAQYPPPPSEQRRYG